MSGIWKRIKAFFFRKKQESPPAEPEPIEAAQEPQPKTYIELKQAKPKQALKQEPDQERGQKSCQKCGAPNDLFVHKCWLCKTEV